MKYKISIGEPWDFQGASGPNVIQGEIISVRSDTALIFESDSVEHFKEGSGKIFLLCSRYKNENLNLHSDYIGTINGRLVLIQNYNKLSDLELHRNSTFVLIGGLATVNSDQ